MTLLQSIVLGVVQGISEFLPISSSGHLVLVPQLLGWAVQDRMFDVAVHVGTLGAVLVYFRLRIISIITSLFTRGGESADRRLFFLICLSIVPAGIVGFFFGDQIDILFRSPRAVAISLIGWGIILYIADRYSTMRVQNPKKLSEMTVGQSILIGCAQAIALIPGTSRSGITMTAGLFQNFSKKAVAEFSFLMSIPVILLAGISTAYEVISTGAIAVTPLSLIAGGLSAFATGLLAIWLVFAVIQKMSFTPFVLYRIVLGIIILMIVV